MGVLTDFVVASRSDAKKVADCSVPSEELGGIDAKGVDPVQMGTLYAILSESEYDPDFMIAEDSFLHVVSDDGPWVQIVPDDMVKRLAGLTEADIPAVAKRWGETEEFEPQYGEWTPEDMCAFLVEISKLSQRAIAEEKSLLMWTCL